MGEQIRISIAGLGILLYSPFAAAHIAEGEDYLQSHYMERGDVLEHVYRGTIVGFGTGSPGDYVLTFEEGYPDDEHMRQCAFGLRLGIEVRDGLIVVKDLYELMDWSSSYPDDQTVAVEDGYYHITLLGDLPASGRLGDDQRIEVYLQRLYQMPILVFPGVPYFGDQTEKGVAR